jgi:redox-sensitive bicupin YhaK (pirin superfamily)
MGLTKLEPHVKDIGDFEVRRLLPAKQRRAIGPFVFWDHFGPVTLPPEANMDVRPHPHIGLATLTWLFDGEIMHRDSLGNTQRIAAGAVNWMTAGRGIVHSERTPDDRRGQEKPLHGLQIWLGLPDGSEEVAPAFEHYPDEAIPRVVLGDISFDLIAGEAMGARSPVSVYSPLFYLAAELRPGQGFDWPRQYAEEAVYVVEGKLTVNDEEVPAHTMAVLPESGTVRIHSGPGARIALLGGEPLGRRHLVWNFVSSRRERIDEALKLWDAGGFDRVDGDDEFIPLPGHLKPVSDS